MSRVKRTGEGRFAKGTPSPNPLGRPLDETRQFTFGQTTKDLLRLLEQPVNVTKGGKKTKVPAIVAIYDKLVHKAVEGDWQAIKKCVELREKYTLSRTETLGKMLEIATKIRRDYEESNVSLPDNLWELVTYTERMVAEGQFRPG